MSDPSGEIMAVQKWADVSDDGLYRYQLTRRWDGRDQATCRGNEVCWVMLNPSTADADVDDPTIRRCMAFTRAWGFGGLRVVNLWALRATDPKALLAAPNPEGIWNEAAICDAIARSHFVVCAWGATVEKMAKAGHRPFSVYAEAKRANRPCRSLGVTNAGHPRHPLYVKGGTPLSFYPDQPGGPQ